MLPFIVGVSLVTASFLYFGFKMYVVYSVAREPFAHGGVPTLDGIIFPPIVFTLGLGLVAKGSESLAIPGWGYGIVWTITTGLAYLSLIIVQDLGARKRRS